MIQTDAGFNAAVAAPAYGQLHLVELQFTSGTLRLTDYPMAFEALGQAWLGLGALGEVGSLHESEDGGAEKLDLSLSQVSNSNLAIGLGNPSNYQDRVVKVWVAVLDAATMTLAGTPALRFVGAMDTVGITPGGADGSSSSSGKITLTCRTASYDARNNPTALRMNDAQHKARHPGERGFEMLASLISAPSPWMTVRAQGRLL